MCASAILPSVCGTEGDALGHHAIADEVPQGDQEFACQSDDHLLARATGVLGSSFKPFRQGAAVLVLEKAPGQLDHSPSHPSIAGSGEPFFSAFLSALVGRTRETRVAGHGAPVAQISYKNLVKFPQEVRREAGFALRLAQIGGKALHALPMLGFGSANVLEVVISEEGNAYRAVYTVRFDEAVYLLHAFQKKSKSGKATPRLDMALIRRRLNGARDHYAGFILNSARKDLSA
jgi:phage-related protein